MTTDEIDQIDDVESYILESQWFHRLREVGFFPDVNDPRTMTMEIAIEHSDCIVFMARLQGTHVVFTGTKWGSSVRSNLPSTLMIAKRLIDIAQATPYLFTSLPDSTIALAREYLG